MYRNKIGSFVQKKISWLGNIGLQMYKVDYEQRLPILGYELYSEMYMQVIIYETVSNNHYLLNGRMRGWPVLAHHVAG